MVSLVDLPREDSQPTAEEQALIERRQEIEASSPDESDIIE